ncbi:MAG: tetratricopeptide repeat protein [Candidatus Tectimicrobiota bacterium]
MNPHRIEALKHLLEQEPHDTMLLFGLGNEYFGAGQYADAIPYFEDAVRVDPNYAAVYIYLARSYEETQQRDLARQTVERGWEPAVRSGDNNLMAEIADIRSRLQ